jgi:RNA polymerase sigma factor (sigma-70 family)
MESKRPFEQVVAEHGATVLRVCRAVLGPHTDADDAWAETFLAALKAYPALPADANVQAWLVTIAHRKAIDITRNRRRHAIPMDELPEQQSTIGIPGAADHDLWDAVQRLPEKQRWAVAYHYLGGLPYDEVAGMIGGSADAARKAASDGIRSLRRTYLTADAHPEGVTR